MTHFMSNIRSLRPNVLSSAVENGNAPTVRLHTESHTWAPAGRCKGVHVHPLILT